MDTTRLNNFTQETKDNVDKIMNVLNEQKEHVKKVTFLENFCKDTDVSLFYGKDIYKGLAVELNSNRLFRE